MNNLRSLTQNFYFSIQAGTKRHVKSRRLFDPESLVYLSQAGLNKPILKSPTKREFYDSLAGNNRNIAFVMIGYFILHQGTFESLLQLIKIHR